MINELMKEIQKLQKAEEILEMLWNDIGPYQRTDLEISDDALRGMRNYFEFDDSE